MTPPDPSRVLSIADVEEIEDDLYRRSFGSDGDSVRSGITLMGYYLRLRATQRLTDAAIAVEGAADGVRKAVGV